MNGLYDSHYILGQKYRKEQRTAVTFLSSGSLFLCRLLSEVVGGLSFHGITLEGSCKSDDSHMEQTEGAHRGKREGLTWRSRGEKGRVSRLGKEPYTCERLSHIRGGYKSLSDSCTALQFDFTDPQVGLF